MANSFRKDIFDFLQNEKIRIQADIEDINKLKNQYYLTSGKKFLKQSSFVFVELLVWLLFIAELVWLVFLFRIPPFYTYNQMVAALKNVSYDNAGAYDLIDWSIRGLVILLAIATFIIARLIAGIRKQNSKTQSAGKMFAQLIALEETRMKDIENIESKYPYLNAPDINIELEDFSNPIMPPPPGGDRLLDE